MWEEYRKSVENLRTNDKCPLLYTLSVKEPRMSYEYSSDVQ